MTVLEIFRLTAGEFSSVPDDTIQQWAELTAPLVSRRRFGKLYEQAVALLTAHRMKLSGQYDAKGEGAASSGIGSIADTLRISSYSEGATSVSFNNTAADTESCSDLGLTAYGVQYSNLRGMVIIPIKCSGEVR